MNITITMTAWHRPDYLRRALDHLGACRGVGRFGVTVSIDGDWPDVQKACHVVNEFSFARAWVHPHLGCNANTLATLDYGFEHVDFVIHVEEDVALAPDALEFFEHAANTYQDSPEVFSATGYSRPVTDREPDPNLVIRRSWFHPWGFALWRNRWAHARAEVANNLNGATWDHYVNAYVMRNGLVEVAPLLARSNNFGRMTSIGTLPPEWYDRNHTLTEWAGDGRQMPDKTIFYESKSTDWPRA